MFTDIVILAGGFGERLWPASRPDYPKQFLSINDGISFLQNAIIRSLALKPTGKITPPRQIQCLHRSLSIFIHQIISRFSYGPWTHQYPLQSSLI